MRRWLPPIARLAGAALLCLAPGCATRPQLTSTDLAMRARANPIAAERDYAKKRIVVQGVVRQTSLAQRTSVVASSYGYTAQAVEKHESLPLVILEPGSVLCYFEPEDVAAAAEIKEAESVRLECLVDSFRVESGNVLAVLAGCDRVFPVKRISHTLE